VIVPCTSPFVPVGKTGFSPQENLGEPPLWLVK